MGIVNHIWGVSAAQDRVWAQVSGLRSAMAGKRLFLPLQAFIDDSYDHPDGIFVLGGCIASAESWAEFIVEWEKMLPYSKLVHKNGKPYFKMSHMASKAGGVAMVPAFYKIIEKHVLAFVSVKIDKLELIRARSRIIVPGAEIIWDEYADPFYVAFRCLMDKFHMIRSDPEFEFLADEKIDFYFDEQTQKKPIISMWDNYMEHRPEEAKKYYGKMPRFESDDEFLPLQAADFWAWWIRKWYKSADPSKRVKPEYSEKKIQPIIMINYNEDQLVTNFIKTLRPLIGANRTIYDSKYFFH